MPACLHPAACRLQLALPRWAAERRLSTLSLDFERESGLVTYVSLAVCEVRCVERVGHRGREGEFKLRRTTGRDGGGSREEFVTLNVSVSSTCFIQLQVLEPASPEIFSMPHSRWLRHDFGRPELASVCGVKLRFARSMHLHITSGKLYWCNLSFEALSCLGPLCRHQHSEQMAWCTAR